MSSREIISINYPHKLPKQGYLFSSIDTLNFVFCIEIEDFKCKETYVSNRYTNCTNSEILKLKNRSESFICTPELGNLYSDFKKNWDNALAAGKISKASFTFEFIVN